MKKILPILLLFLSTIAIAQNKDYLLSLEGIGELKLDMPITELEKLLKTKITLKIIGVHPVQLTETIKVKYKGIDVEIDLITNRVNGMSTSSPLCKTSSGIGIGSTKLQIIDAYEGYHVGASPVYTEEGNKLLKSKTMSTITVKKDKEGNAIEFTLLNKKVVSFRIYPIYDDEED